jgi:hypothetical protein
MGLAGGRGMAAMDLAKAEGIGDHGSGAAASEALRSHRQHATVDLADALSAIGESADAQMAGAAGHRGAPGDAPLGHGGSTCDTTGDGWINAVDTIGDGRPNAFDTTGDGQMDAIDTMGDGQIDIVADRPCLLPGTVQSDPITQRPQKRALAYAQGTAPALAIGDGRRPARRFGCCGGRGSRAAAESTPRAAELAALQARLEGLRGAGLISERQRDRGEDVIAASVVALAALHRLARLAAAFPRDAGFARQLRLADAGSGGVDER